MTTTTDQLRDAKRALEKIEGQIKNVMLDNRCEVPMTQQQRDETRIRFGQSALDAGNGMTNHPAWHELYYGSCGGKKAAKHLASLAKDFPAVASQLEPLVAQMTPAIEAIEAARAVEKAEMQARRDARAAKASQKKELGVDLQAKGGEKATVETYNALRAGLKTIESALADWLFDGFKTDFAAIDEKLAAKAGRLDLAFPKHERNWKTRQMELVVGSFESPHPLFSRIFDTSYLPHPVRGYSSQIKTDAASIMRSEADRAADEALAGFCAKLAGKVDREMADSANGVLQGAVEGVSCTTTNIWNNSVLTVRTNYWTQVWHTKVIWNRSVLGKQFNQWPTRRVY